MHIIIKLTKDQERTKFKNNNFTDFMRCAIINVRFYVEKNICTLGGVTYSFSLEMSLFATS